MDLSLGLPQVVARQLESSHNIHYSPTKPKPTSSHSPRHQQVLSTKQSKPRDTRAQSACFTPPSFNHPSRATTPQRPPASASEPTHTTMLNLRSALVAATLAVSALAVPQITVPAAGASLPVTATTQISVEWKDDGEAPKISALQSFTLQLIVGGNTADDSVNWDA